MKLSSEAIVYVYYDLPCCKAGMYKGQDGRDIKKRIKKYVGEINNKLFKHIPLTEEEKDFIKKSQNSQREIFESRRGGYCPRDAKSPRIKTELL